jgi:ABC-type sugar transport system substrate-binding protein
MGWVRRTLRRLSLRGRSRLQEEPPPLWFVTGVTVLVGLGVLGVLNLMSVDGGTTLGVAGLVLGVAVPVAFDRRSRASRSHAVIFLDYRDHLVGMSAWRGMQEALAEEPSIHVFRRKPETHVYPAEWQIEYLASREARSASAIVVMPPPLNRPQALDIAAPERPLQPTALSHALAQLAADGVFVVSVDEPLQATPFVPALAPMPRHVQADYAAGGDRIGRWLVSRMRCGPNADHASVLLFLGPELSPPGRTRSMRVLYEVTRAGLADRVETRELPDFDRGRTYAVQAVLERVRLLDGPSVLYVEAGDDEMALAINDSLRELPSETANKVHVIGYDGTRNAAGEYDVLHASRVVATVDSQTDVWGRRAADYLLAEREGSISRLAQVQLVPPLLVSFDADRRIHYDDDRPVLLG